MNLRFWKKDKEVDDRTTLIVVTSTPSITLQYQVEAQTSNKALRLMKKLQSEKYGT